MVPSPGEALDREVARRLGEPNVPPARFSTDPAVEDRIVTALGRQAVEAVYEEVEALWYCVLTADVAGTRERVASGSGETRSLALCRAVAHLPVRPPKASTAAPSSFVGKKGVCQECGVALEKGSRSQARYCSVCAYRRGKPAHAAFEQTRHSRRRRSAR